MYQTISTVSTAILTGKLLCNLLQLVLNNRILMPPVYQCLAKKYFYFLFFLSFFVGAAGITNCSGQAYPPESSQNEYSTIQCRNIHFDSQNVSRSLNTQTVSEIMAAMSLREKIGQLFFVRSNGYFVSEDDEDFQKLVHQIKDLNVGGITFFAGNVCGQAMLTNKFQSMSEIPLWISQDMEFGAAM